MITSEAFARAEPHKWAAVERTPVTPTRSQFHIPLGMLVPVYLVAFGAVFTVRR